MEDEGKLKMKETDSGWQVYTYVNGGQSWDGWDDHLVEEELFEGTFSECCDYIELKKEGTID